jgi:hypothetical protein
MLKYDCLKLVKNSPELELAPDCFKFFLYRHVHHRFIKYQFTLIGYR